MDRRRLGGGSLELVDVHGSRVRGRCNAAIGGLALQDTSPANLKKAEKYCQKKLLEDLDMLHDGGGPHLLRGRRHMARAGSTAHVADRLSFSRHA